MWTSRRPLHISRLKVRNVKLFKFWEVREVEHLAVENRDFSCNPRFSNVLTKLQVQVARPYTQTREKVTQRATILRRPSLHQSMYDDSKVSLHWT